MGSDFCHEFICQFRNPLQGQPLLFITTLTSRYNLYIVAISLGVGMTPTLSHDFFSKLPAVLQPLLHSGIMLATLSAVVLNVFFNGYQHHADLVKESVSDKDLKVRTVRMWLLMRKLKKNEHGE